MDKNELNKWRLFNRLTLKQTAEELGLNYTTVARYATGKYPIPRIVDKLIRAKLKEPPADIDLKDMPIIKRGKRAAKVEKKEDG